MKKFKFFVILMCLSLCFGGTAYAAQAQKTNDDLIIVVLGGIPCGDGEMERSENVLTATGHVLQNPLRLVLSLPEKLGETTVTVKDAQTNVILGATMVNTIQESTITLNFKQGSGHFELKIKSANYSGKSEFVL